MKIFSLDVRSIMWRLRGRKRKCIFSSKPYCDFMVVFQTVVDPRKILMLPSTTLDPTTLLFIVELTSWEWAFFLQMFSYCSAMLVVVGFGFVSVVNQRLCWLKSGTSSNIGCRLVILLNPAYRSLEHISWPIHRTIIQSSNMDWLIHT